MTEHDHGDLAGMSDDELRALEDDRSLPMDRWMAVEAERGRREQAKGGPRRSAAAAPPSAASQRSVPRSPEAASSAAPPRGRGLDDATEDYRVRAALAQLNALLVPGERLLAYAVQRRLFALTHRRVIAGATTGRFVVLSRGLFGGYDLFDVRWQDLQDANVHAGIFGATLHISSFPAEDFASTDRAVGRPGVGAAFVGFRTDQAERVYAICQAQEQVWREKRRVRDLDELRAQSGGVQIGAGAVSGSASAAAPAGDPLDRLRRAKEMLDDGLISDTEYESIKARVVDGL